MLERSAIFKTASPTATLPAPGSGRDPGSHGLGPLYHTQGCSKVRGGSDFAGGVQGPDQWALRGGGHVDYAVGPEEPPQPSDPEEGPGAGAVGGAPSAEPPGRDAVEPAASAPPRQPLDSDQPPGTGLLPRAPRRETRAAVSCPVCGRLSQWRSRAGSPARHCGHFLSCGTGPSPSASPRLSAATTSDPWTGSRLRWTHIAWPGTTATFQTHGTRAFLGRRRARAVPGGVSAERNPTALPRGLRRPDAKKPAGLGREEPPLAQRCRSVTPSRGPRAPGGGTRRSPSGAGVSPGQHRDVTGFAVWRWGQVRCRGVTRPQLV